LVQCGAEADQLVECYYYGDYDGDDYGCQVHNVDLSKKTRSEKFTFSGTQEQKKNTTEIHFEESGRVAHVPRNLHEEFPKLTKLWITRSEIPIVKNNLFGPEFSWIKGLSLRENKIQIIEEEAFKHLQNLERIYLYYNQIQSLNAKVFQNNRKLEKIWIWKNKIKMIAPETFRHLNQLEWVELEWNDCVNKEIGCSWCNKIDHTKLNRDLHACYENHKKSSDLLNEGENKNFMKIIKKIISKKSKTCKNFCFQINFGIFEEKINEK
jgi:hypothetical protein